MVDVNDVIDKKAQDVSKLTEDDLDEDLEDNSDDIDEGEPEASAEKETPPEMTKDEEKATVGAMVEIAGNILVKVRRVPKESKEEFLSEYHAMTEQLLILIGFGKAISKLPVSEMKPSTTIMLGLGLMVVVGLMIRVTPVEAQPQYSTHNPPPAQKPQRPVPPSTPGPEVNLQNYQIGGVVRQEGSREQQVQKENQSIPVEHVESVSQEPASEEPANNEAI